MKFITVAPVGDNMGALYVGIKEFPTESVVLIAHDQYQDEAEKAEKELKKFRVPVKIVKIDGDIWEETFKAISEIRKTSDSNILVNVATGDRNLQCAATSAAFVNGLKAFSVGKKDVMMLPVMKFSYYRLIPEKKWKILSLLYQDRNCCASFEEISKRLSMSLPLVSYHINGNVKSEGLKQMGLVDIMEKRGRFQVNLAPLGKLLIEGHVDSQTEKKK